MTGKWDAGMATLDHTPRGRGYDRAMNYFHHDNDYWSMTVGGCPTDPTHPQKTMTPVVDLWAYDGAKEQPAWGVNNTCSQPPSQPMCPGGSARSGRVCGGGCTEGPNNIDAFGWNGYEDAVFEQEMLRAIDEADPDKPLFLCWTPHIVHTPLQVPQHFYDKFGFIANETGSAADKADHPRQIYHAMVNFADSALGNITDKLKAKGWWDESLVVFSTDNGGPVYNNGAAGANNYPLRGGKMTARSHACFFCTPH